jgi:hypothetical protein
MFTTDAFDLEEEQTGSTSDKKIAFIFVCDRSGSMYDIRIGLVREAL